MVDGLRYGMTGHHDGSVMCGAMVMGGMVVALWMLTQRMLFTGYRMRS
jgi:hypothetical protein